MYVLCLHSYDFVKNLGLLTVFSYKFFYEVFTNMASMGVELQVISGYIVTAIAEIVERFDYL